MQPGRRKHQSATIIVDRRVRAAGPGASHRFIVSTTVQLRSSKLVAAHRGAEAIWPMKGCRTLVEGVLMDAIRRVLARRPSHGAMA